MKITLLVLFILFTGLWTGSAFGQTEVSVLSNQPQVIESPSHPQHAEIHRFPHGGVKSPQRRPRRRHEPAIGRAQRNLAQLAGESVA